MNGVLVGLLGLLLGQAAPVFGWSPLSLVPHLIVVAGGLLGLTLAPAGRWMEASRGRRGWRAFAVVLLIFLCFQLPLGAGYAFDWIHFTAGAGRFHLDRAWQWALGAAEWYVLALLGPSLVLFGLLQASLEPRPLARAAPALAVAAAGLVGMASNGIPWGAEALVERVIVPGLAAAALAQLYGRGGSLPDVALALGLLAFTQRYLICNAESEFMPVGYYVIGQPLYLLLQVAAGLLALGLAAWLTRPGPAAP